MPNGFQGPDDEWQKMEAPLVAVDAILTSFAARHDLKLSANHHSWPERSLTWGHDIRRKMQLYLNDEKNLTFHLWLCASQDRGTQRFWRHAFLFKDQTEEQFASRLGADLEEGLRTVNRWTAQDLEESR